VGFARNLDRQLKFARQGPEPQPGTPDDFAAVIHREIARTAELIRLTGLKAE
jgi:hypothetical protein